MGERVIFGLVASVTLLFFGQRTVADDLTRQVQEQLRAQGFYSGRVDGNPSAEFAAALRRYQIRHGLAVTGILDHATARALDDETGMVRTNPVEVPPPTPEPLANSQPARATALPPSPTPFPSPGSATAVASPPSRLTPATAVTERVQKFIEDYLRAGESNDVGAQVRFFAFPVDYFEHGRVNATFLRQDTSSYVRRWPTRRYLLTDPVRITGSSRDKVNAEFTIAFSVQNPKRRATGRTSNSVTLRDRNGELRIIAIREQRLPE
jgi:hypothetical protein